MKSVNKSEAGNEPKQNDEEDDPFLNQKVEKEKAVKVMHPLTENEIAEYTQIFYRFLDKNGN